MPLSTHWRPPSALYSFAFSASPFSTRAASRSAASTFAFSLHRAESPTPPPSPFHTPALPPQTPRIHQHRGIQRILRLSIRLRFIRLTPSPFHTPPKPSPTSTAHQVPRHTALPRLFIRSPLIRCRRLECRLRLFIRRPFRWRRRLNRRLRLFMLLPCSLKRPTPTSPPTHQVLSLQTPLPTRLHLIYSCLFKKRGLRVLFKFHDVRIRHRRLLKRLRCVQYRINARPRRFIRCPFTRCLRFRPLPPPFYTLSMSLSRPPPGASPPPDRVCRIHQVPPPQPPPRQFQQPDHTPSDPRPSFHAPLSYAAHSDGAAALTAALAAFNVASILAHATLYAAYSSGAADRSTASSAAYSSGAAFTYAAHSDGAAALTAAKAVSNAFSVAFAFRPQHS